jgi:hypothetical protein
MEEIPLLPEVHDHVPGGPRPDSAGRVRMSMTRSPDGDKVRAEESHAAAEHPTWTRLVFSTLGTHEGDELDGTHAQRHIIAAPASPRGGAPQLLTGRNCRD